MTEEFDTATATGRLMLTMLSGFAAHERELIRERSVAGTNRLAEAGVWLGGVVPYGYRKDGERGQGRIVGQRGSDSRFQVERSRGRPDDLPDVRCREEIVPEDRRPPEPHWRFHAARRRARKADAGKRNRRKAADLAAIPCPEHDRQPDVHGRARVRQTHQESQPEADRPRGSGDRLRGGWEAAQQVLRSNRIMCRRNTREPYLFEG